MIIRPRLLEPRPRLARPAFTLVEALVAISIAAVAGSAVLLGLNNSLQTTNSALEQTIAAGLAQQALDEISGAAFADLGSYQGSRALPATPPGYFNRWQQQVDVYYVGSDMRTPSAQPTDYRAVRVRVLIRNSGGASREVINLGRVVADVPQP
ncbi:MAG: type IV pilus modification PilV family protein [Pirellulales bacterium]|jgi:type II secretory pathway pseudopilin PulG